MLDQELRQQVSRYVTGRIRRSTLEHWLVPLYAEIESAEVDPATRELAARTMRILAERAHGDWTEAEAKAALEPWIDTYLLASPERSITSGTAEILPRGSKRRRGEGRAAVAAGRRLAAASG